MNREKLKEILENHKKGIVENDTERWEKTSWGSDDALIKIILEAILED